MTNYEERAKTGLVDYQHNQSALLLAIESSCDETAASVLMGGRQVRSMAVHTQIPLHRKFGGVVPELASRSHVERVGGVVREALRQADATLSDMAALAVTCGPGLVGALLVGVSYAKGLAFAQGLPFIGVNHLAGHIAANYLTFADLEPPFTCLVASGGHSHIVAVESYTAFRLLGCTRDDAAGEAFDKVARTLGLPYPGGPELEKLARSGDETRYPLHAGFNEGPGLDMSFSGLKTAVVNLIHNAGQRGEEVDAPSLAASFQRAVCTTLTDKAVRAALAQGSHTLALAGGVSANQYLRAMLEAACKRQGLRFCCPDFRFCTDNAAMIGCAGHYALLTGARSGLKLNAAPGLPLCAK
ncbi:MAG: tRNA (adenosine(37)-N6)-threonylcarbamoyltransferase complex transferase subunit TsaD [Clostridia bacterium]|nr:tRNA (adenosine(37)-N6)-threonylcarbamoyltransferase complex transferase subunit TsaD [Candidatus Pelethousia sp.]NCB30036.1 tRNA (adenosine(37)-N6)-threonylcarbamoyltransferase complex transferase subunit TsaD [Clostridia bacterium]